MEPQIQEAVDAVEALCAPELMSKAEAVEFLESVVARLDSSIEALKDEIANTTNEDT